MSAHEQILELYGSVSAKSAEMLDAARRGDWDRLVELEKDCRALIDTLKRTDEGASAPDAEYLRRKAELIRKVLADDVEIRRHTEPWMEKLQALLGSARQLRKIERAYGASDAG